MSLVETHRRNNRMTSLVARAGSGALCVLGAGNANDLDVGELLASYARVHLVDLDASAVARAAARLAPGAGDRVATHAPVEVSGAVARLEACARRPLGAADVAAAVTAPGGTALLATDVVSSGTYPIAERLASIGPGAVLDELRATGNLFTGTDPALVTRLLRRDPELAARVEAARAETPWPWRLSEQTTLLVCALAIRMTAIPGRLRL